VKCETSFTGTPATLGASGGQVAARVVTLPECAWSATTDVPWLRVDPPSGQGETAVTLYVAPNQLPSTRTAAIQINDVQLTLAQAAPSPRTSPNPLPSSVQFFGQVSGLTGTCPDLVFIAAGRTVETEKKTRFNHGNCKHLRNGMDVDVTGNVTTRGTVYATRIGLDDDD
jgi:hypothetical protein